MPARTEARRPAVRLAIVGAESSGKTTLAAALAKRLQQDTGLRVTWVPEWLREWCAHTGRTPLAHEQAAVLRGQHERIEAAAADFDIVVCDTTALMTAVYSQQVFGDRSLDARALQLHSRMDLTLLMALDLPWVADGLQRDGPHVQGPVDTQLRERLMAQHQPWAVVSGHGGARLDSALAAAGPVLRQRLGSRAPGLFTGLAGRDSDNANANPRWSCDCCDVPACERQLRAR
jgi:nicotinamide riboside kinase